MKSAFVFLSEYLLLSSAGNCADGAAYDHGNFTTHCYAELPGCSKLDSNVAHCVVSPSPGLIRDFHVDFSSPPRAPMVPASIVGTCTEKLPMRKVAEFPETEFTSAYGKLTLAAVSVKVPVSVYEQLHNDSSVPIEHSNLMDSYKAGLNICSYEFTEEEFPEKEYTEYHMNLSKWCTAVELCLVEQGCIYKAGFFPCYSLTDMRNICNKLIKFECDGDEKEISSLIAHTAGVYLNAMYRCAIGICPKKSSIYKLPTEEFYREHPTGNYVSWSIKKAFENDEVREFVCKLNSIPYFMEDD